MKARTLLAVFPRLDAGSSRRDAFHSRRSGMGVRDECSRGSAASPFAFSGTPCVTLTLFELRLQTSALLQSIPFIPASSKKQLLATTAAALKADGLVTQARIARGRAKASTRQGGSGDLK
eukprot:3280075-Pleurochrysis_carterae.AAC.6